MTRRHARSEVRLMAAPGIIGRTRARLTLDNALAFLAILGLGYLALLVAGD